MEKLALKELTFTNNWMGFLALLRNWSIIITTILLSLQINNIVFYLIALAVIGFFQFAIGEALLHEAAHNHLFKSPWLNENLSFLYAEPFFYTLSIYRDSHFPHHLYFRTEKDSSWPLYKDLGLKKKKCIHFEICLLEICLGRASLVHLNYFISFYSVHSPLRVILFWLGTLFIFYNLGAIPILLLYWITPYVLVFPVILYWNVLVNHYHTETGTRTVMNPLSNWIAHNNGYHHTHHLFPSVPWYNLPKAYQELDLEGNEVTRNLWDSFRQLRGKSRQLGLECNAPTEELERNFTKESSKFSLSVKPSHEY